MKVKRAHILLPQELVKEIDSIVGPRGRSAFLVETAREAVRRKKLLRFLESDTPAWKDADHPELGPSAAEFVRELRQESEKKRAKKQWRAKK
jgi:Arc/MetJ-type ribon-helix-helix transcriptional regulator